MGHLSNDAVVKDAKIMLRVEERAFVMEQQGNSAVVKDVQMVLSKEEYA